MKKKDVPSAKSRIDKLGVTGGARVFLDGVFDAPFHQELDARGAQPVSRMRDAGLIFLAVDDPESLLKVGAAARQMAEDAAVWCVWPKGRQSLKEDHIRAAAIAEGLVDVKVMKFSESHSGLKLVVPLARRKTVASKKKKASTR